MTLRSSKSRLLTIALSVAASILGIAQSASADFPDDPLETTRRIRRALVSIKVDSIPEPVHSEYFQYELSEQPLDTPDGRAAYQYFTGHFGEGAVYFNPALGAAFEIHGAILPVWRSYDHERGLGYPTTDEWGTDDGIGRISSFDRGEIVWHPDFGAHAVYGAFRDSWLSKIHGNPWIYPVDDEHTVESWDQPEAQYCDRGGRTQNFFTPETGTWSVWCWSAGGSVRSYNR